tara:strand:+ start:5690 stop:6121 length:432 start_codon:yes stop_codon:yes gene_type:complete
MLFRLSSQDVQLPRLIGAFILLVAILMFVRAGAQMFDSWDTLKSYPDCIASIGSGTDEVAQLQYMDCKDSLYGITGLQLKGAQDKMSTRQFWFALLGPIGNLFIWAIVFLLGIVFYNTGNLIVPIEQSVREIPDVKLPAAKKK